MSYSNGISVERRTWIVMWERSLRTQLNMKRIVNVQRRIMSGAFA